MFVEFWGRLNILVGVLGDLFVCLFFLFVVFFIDVVFSILLFQLWKQEGGDRTNHHTK